MKKQRKKYKSIITKRIFQSTKKIVSVLGLLVLILAFGKIQGTNSYFTGTASSTGNTMTAGYWIPPAISIASPSSGKEWQVGSVQDIVWTITTSDPVATITSLDLTYACDGHADKPITNFSSNPGHYNWTVPQDISNSCKIKVSATDSHALSNSQASANFAISWMVALNEFVPYPAATDLEFVEIYNYGTENIDVNNWRITDNHGPDTNERIIDSSHTDTGSTIIGHGTSRFLVIKNYANFYLNNTGIDEVRLYDANKKLIDSHGYSDPLQGKAYARIKDGVGNWVDPVPTPGKKNVDDADIKDFQKYYKEICFKDNKPICDLEFLKSLGLVDDKSKPIVENKEIIQTDLIVPEPTPAVETDPTPEPKIETIPETTPAPIVKPEDNSDQAKLDAQAKAKADEEAKAKLEAEQKAKADAEEQAKKDAEDKAKKEDNKSQEIKPDETITQ